MRQEPAVRPIQTSAERPAPQIVPEVWLRDYDGEHSRRVPLDMANRMVSDGIADRVSAAGHVRLKLGVRMMRDIGTHGLPAVEESRRIRGDKPTSRDIGHMDRRVGKWRPPPKTRR